VSHLGSGSFDVQFNCILQFSVNCNGDRPIYSTCSDSACEKCTESQYEGNICVSQGAGASKMFKCHYPAGFNQNKAGGGLGGMKGVIEENAAPVHYVSTTVVLVALALVPLARWMM
jgi:hypothetical protein